MPRLARTKAFDPRRRPAVMPGDASAAAREMFRAHGPQAIGIISTRLIERSRTADERRADRAILDELERIDWIRRFGPEPEAFTVETPFLAGLIGAAAMVHSPFRLRRRVRARLRALGGSIDSGDDESAG